MALSTMHFTLTCFVKAHAADDNVEEAGEDARCRQNGPICRPSPTLSADESAGPG